jgi:hypothetical protein
VNFAKTKITRLNNDALLAFCFGSFTFDPPPAPLPCTQNTAEDSIALFLLSSVNYASFCGCDTWSFIIGSRWKPRETWVLVEKADRHKEKNELNVLLTVEHFGPGAAN